MILIVNDTLGAYGGSQLQICRIGQWASSNNINFYVFAETMTNTEVIELLKQSRAHLCEVGIYNTRPIEKLMKEICKDKTIQVQVINFTFMHYLDMEYIKNKCRLSFKNIMIDIHPKAFELGTKIKNGIIKKIYTTEIKKTFLAMNKTRDLFFMDEVNIKNSEEFFDCKLDPAPQITRVPMFFEEDFDWRIKAERAFENNTILTVTRAEFPFKGYVLGLIDDFKEIAGIYDDYKLEIICGGDDIERVEKKINELPSQIKKRVSLHYWMSNDEVKEEMIKCKVFIGMGSTLLEAASVYRPAITVRYYTEENLARDFIADAPNIVVQREDCESRAIDLIIKVINSEKKAYYEMCKNSFENVRKVYDTNVVMKKLVNAKVKGYKTTTMYMRWAHLLHNWIARHRYKEAGFDYNKMKKEGEVIK